MYINTCKSSCYEISRTYSCLSKTRFCFLMSFLHLFLRVEHTRHQYQPQLNRMQFFAHICAYAYTYICAHLEALSSRCICPFLMRVFKSRPATFLPFCKSTIESSSIQFEKNGQGHAGKVWSPDFSFRLCIQLTVSRQIWFHIWAARETRMPNILLSSLFKYAAPHARIALRRDTASKIVPPSFDLCFE